MRKYVNEITTIGGIVGRIVAVKDESDTIIIGPVLTAKNCV